MAIEVNMTPPHPGDFIRVEIIEEQGLSLKDAAHILGVPEQPLSDLLNDGAELSPEMARALSNPLAWARICHCECKRGEMRRRSGLARTELASDVEAFT